VVRGVEEAGVRDASRFGPSAPQMKLPIDFLPGMDVGEQSEDCLYLNVFTPAVSGSRRPVFVWIHGGAFTIGSGSQALYDVRPSVRRGDVIVVTVNYRLVFGGLLGACHGIDVPFVMGSIGTPGGDRFAGSGPEALRRPDDGLLRAWEGIL
jgi:hypothetical protein